MVKHLECEICGGQVDKKNYVSVDGATLVVCDSCVKFGIEVPKPIIHKQYKSTISVTSKKEDTKKELNRVIFESQLRNDYYKIIKDSREKLGLKQDEFAQKIMEKPSLISKIETGKIEPDKKLIKKLEKFLNIKLVESIEEGPSKKKSKDVELTLGDIITIKKRKKD